MDQTEIFEAERPRLLGIASRVLGDHAEAEDVVQQAWLRLDRALTRRIGTEIDNLPAWLTTVTTRLCLDRLRARTPVPYEEVEVADTAPDPADDVALADTVGIALQAVIDRLSPRERVAFVLHDSFGFEFAHDRRGPRHHSGGRPQARLASPGQGRPAGGRGRARGLGGGRRVHGRCSRRRLRAAAPAARARRRRRRRRGRDPGRHPVVDRGPRRGRHLLQRQRPVGVPRPRRRPPGVGLVPARRGLAWSSTSPSRTARSAPSPSVPHPTSSPGSYAAPVPTRREPAVTSVARRSSDQ